MWPNRTFTDFLGIEHPIVQSPMAVYTTPSVAAGVSNAGGLGSLGCGEMTAEEVVKTVAEVRTITNKPVNLNFMAHDEAVYNKDVTDAMMHKLKHFFESRNLPLPDNFDSPFKSFNQEIVDALVEIEPQVVSFHFGLPKLEWVNTLRDCGCLIMCSATTVDEAEILEKAGVDIIIAQGWEAGGHQGSFEPHDTGMGTGTLALVPQIVDAVNTPVIAAGGIADGRGIVASMILGAAGVQMGTAFLLCPDMNVSESHRNAVRSARDNHTRLSKAISGRAVRVGQTRYTEFMAEQQVDYPDYPDMYNFTFPLIDSSEENGDDEFLYLPFGQAASMSQEMSTTELVEMLVKECENIFKVFIDNRL